MSIAEEKELTLAEIPALTALYDQLSEIPADPGQHGAPSALLAQLTEGLSRELESSSWREALRGHVEGGAVRRITLRAHDQASEGKTLNLPWELALDPFSKKPLWRLERLLLSRGPAPSVPNPQPAPLPPFPSKS